MALRTAVLVDGGRGGNHGNITVREQHRQESGNQTRQNVEHDQQHQRHAVDQRQAPPTAGWQAPALNHARHGALARDQQHGPAARQRDRDITGRNQQQQQGPEPRRSVQREGRQNRDHHGERGQDPEQNHARNAAQPCCQLRPRRERTPRGDGVLAQQDCAPHDHRNQVADEVQRPPDRVADQPGYTRQRTAAARQVIDVRQLAGDHGDGRVRQALQQRGTEDPESRIQNLPDGLRPRGRVQYVWHCAILPGRSEVARMRANLTVAELVAEGVRRLRAAPGGTEAAATAELDAQLLLSHVMAVARARLKSHPEELADPSHTQHYRRLLARRAAGEPLAYLTGSRDFWSLTLKVTPAVLIPRPETELLVERALALRTAAASRVADLGTGCGAVALALASERPRWQVGATAACADALGIARANAGGLGLGRVELRQGDWYQPLRGERFDLLVSNPPYVAQDDPALETAPLRPEPPRAPPPAANAPQALLTLRPGAPPPPSPGGWLLLEHGATQGADV